MNYQQGDVHFNETTESQIESCNPIYFALAKTAAVNTNQRTMRVIFDAMREAAREDRFYLPHEVAERWENWCGETPWSTKLREFGQLGGIIRWWGGYPRSASAIPLCFALYTPDGDKIPGKSRLKDIQQAINFIVDQGWEAQLESEGNPYGL